MLRWLQKLFTTSDVDHPAEDDDAIWNVMQKMDSRNSLARLRQLKLQPEQFAVVKGLVAGTLKPADQIGVSDWCRQEKVSEAGLEAVAFALRGALESVGITYVFSKPEQTPLAMIPRYVNPIDLTIVVSFVGQTPVVITSLADFLNEQRVSEYILEILTPSQFQRRMTGLPDFAKDPLDREQASSVTIEKLADENGQLLESFETNDLIEAIRQELNYEITHEQMQLSNDEITKTGLYTAIIQKDSLTQRKVLFWIVPKAQFR